MLAQQQKNTTSFGEIEPPKQRQNDGSDEDPQVGIVAFEVRSEKLYQENKVWYRYHTACFYRMRRERAWYIERAAPILFSEAKAHSWRCAHAECAKLLIEPLF